jgi:hypothetical protein
MTERVMSPVPQAPQEGPYEYTAWPAWFYGPGDKREIFERAEDVPDGWVDYDAFMAGELAEAEASGVTGEDRERVLTNDQRDTAINKLIDAHTQADLATMLADMRELDDSIEFLPSWPKVKLATAIVENGGPLDAEKE